MYVDVVQSPPSGASLKRRGIVKTKYPSTDRDGNDRTVPAHRFGGTKGDPGRMTSGRRIILDHAKQ